MIGRPAAGTVTDTVEGFGFYSHTPPTVGTDSVLHGAKANALCSLVCRMAEARAFTLHFFTYLRVDPCLLVPRSRCPPPLPRLPRQPRGAPRLGVQGHLTAWRAIVRC